MSSFRSKMTSSKTSPSTPARVGDARKGKGNTFSQLAALSDSEEELVTRAVTPVAAVKATAAPCVTVLSATRDAAQALQAALAADPMLMAMMRGDVLWGDLAYDEELAKERRSGVVRPAFNAVAFRKEQARAEQAKAQAELEALSAQEALIWDQPFGRNLEMYWTDCYDTRDLTDAEYADCMAWLYDQGWEVEGEIRSGMKAWPADLPPRVWVAPRGPSRFDALSSVGDTRSVGHQSEVQAPVRTGRPPAGGKKSVTVPRFCRASGGGVACADAACRYVHADTMPRLDKACGFGSSCGGTDPAKRAACLYMHPGETWSADLVVTRPAPAPVAAPAASGGGCSCTSGCGHGN